MTQSKLSESLANREFLELVPRMKDQGYSDQDLAARRAWVIERTGCKLENVAACTIPGKQMRGNIENPIGTVQMPLGVAGPLLVAGEFAQGSFYVPLATTEGALVRSYERGMVTLTRSGGVKTRIHADVNTIAPTFFFEDVAEAFSFAKALPGLFEAIRTEAESTTRHGKLSRLETQVLGREVIVSFSYDTADAMGMNMIAKATHQGCEWLMKNSSARDYFIFSGMASEKRASGYLFAGGKGKKVTAGALIGAKALKAYLHVTPARLCELWKHTVLGHIQAGALGYNGHLANGLTALFIACGQDVANVVNSSVGITLFEVTESGDLYASVTLPALSLATVGGGVGLGTSTECLAMLGCVGSGRVKKLAEIFAATLLAGELSFGAAIASGEFTAAHENYGRNRPD